MTYRVSRSRLIRLWGYIQVRVFNAFSWLISQIKAKGWANRLVESHFWCCHFWRENSNICYNRALQTIKSKWDLFYVFEILWNYSYNFWKICLLHSFKVASLSLGQSHSVSKSSKMSHMDFYCLKHAIVANIWIFAQKMAASKMWFYQSICSFFGFILRY